jgi:hypothetical protein
LEENRTMSKSSKAQMKREIRRLKWMRDHDRPKFKQLIQRKTADRMETIRLEAYPETIFHGDFKERGYQVEDIRKPIFRLVDRALREHEKLQTPETKDMVRKLESEATYWLSRAIDRRLYHLTPVVA